ncbi:MAG TPA: tetratricopeptide repeat protein [Terriglobales bacterium]|nr:tetratricopeptide repeat protein [Terriglobales bacterium]
MVRHAQTRRGLEAGLIILVLIAAAGCNVLKARSDLNKGVQAYKNAKYDQAIEYFKDSVALDPNLINARLYLATAYAQQFVPGVDSPENNKSAEAAIDQYQQVLKLHPAHEQQINSLKGIAYLYLQMKKFDEAKQYYREAIKLDANDPELYYSIAVIDWTQVYQPRMKLWAEQGLKPTDELKSAKACQQLKDENGDKVNEGLDMLDKALKLRAEYPDAMAYMNLLYREKAHIDCGDPQTRQADLKTADSWVDKSISTRKELEAKQRGPQGITVPSHQ